MNLRVGSFCSGIAAPEVAWRALGWVPQFFSEIEPFPCAVLAHHFPGVPNLGDMEKVDGEALRGRVDVVCAGTPCQSFSVAGLRGGMADPRGNLALVFLRLVDQIRPRWVVWENVPGVLSSNGGRDFGAFLGGLGQLGYGWAYRVLDAQYFGVPQRRRRVFVVGHLGDWRRAAAVLFERHCLSGHPEPRREAQPRTAGGVAGCLNSGGGNGGFRTEPGEHLIGCLNANGKAAGSATQQDAESGMLVAHAVRSKHNLAHRADVDTLVTHSPVAFSWQQGGSHPTRPPTMNVTEESPSLSANQTPAVAYQCQGSNVGEAGTLRKGNGNTTGGVPFLLDTFRQQGMMHGYADAAKTNAGTLLQRLREEAGEEAFAQWGLGILDSLQPPEVLRPRLLCEGEQRAEEAGPEVVGGSSAGEEGVSERAVREVREAGRQRRRPHQWRLERSGAEQLATYLSELPQQEAPTAEALRPLWEASEGLGVLRDALSAFQAVGRPVGREVESAHRTLSVRRLTPLEAERLQGFPDGHTAIPFRAKPAADGPRYRAIGNSMAVPVLRWIGERIEAVDAVATISGKAVA